jgi:leukotriene-A4 hydrolase
MNRIAIALSFLLSVTSTVVVAQYRKPVDNTDNGPKIAPIDRQAMSNRLKDEAKPRPMDTHSNANPHEAVITHLELDVIVNFDKQRIKGTAAYSIKNRGSELLVLDTKGLEIVDVKDENGTDLKFKLQKPDSIKGSALAIMIGKETAKVVVSYSTTPESAGLQWLTPEQNDGKTPFLYSQGQAILTRSWIPIQDSPSVRITYTARVTVPEDMIALMGAMGNVQGAFPGQTVFEFKQPNAIPPYLISLAVGQLEFKQVSERTGVYALSGVLPDAVSEFHELDKMLAASEKLCGPYVWERFDVLVLPASFPFGGMENPMLTFATPTILAGDRSLVSLIIHELAHSWSGNLVTNANWNDFWLNEGWTVYLERRIVEDIYGKEMADMMEVLGFQDLKATIAEMPKDHPDSGLSLKLEGRDPDDGMTDVAYERGAMVVKEIELAWGRKAFDTFIPHYFKSFSFRSITTDEFIRFVDNYAETNKLNKVELREMVAAVGEPTPSYKVYSGSLMAVEKARVAFLTGRKLTDYGAEKWSAQERQYFLRILTEKLSEEQMNTIYEVLALKKSKNSEVNFEWYLLSIRNNRMSIQSELEDFLRTVGRRKFILPLYKELFANSEWSAWAKEYYVKNRGRYHSITSGSVDRLLD